MRRAVAVLALVAGAALLFNGATASAGIGQGPCQHGNSNKACRDDPQPTHGKDCEHHGGKGKSSHANTTGNGQGNQDHCKSGTVTPTPSPSPSSSVGGETVVQGKIIKVKPAQLAKTGPMSASTGAGFALVLLGTGLFVRTYSRKDPVDA